MKAIAWAALVAVAVLLAAMWLDRRRETVLPAPSGPYAVGRVLTAWSDAQPDDLAPLPGARRELAAWIWYPAAPRPHPAPEEYLPAPWLAAVQRQRGSLVLRLLNRDLSRVRPHAIRDAAVSPAERAFPVAILRAGASALTAEYTALAEDLASHGYVVAGIDAPWRTQVVVFPDGRVMTRTKENDGELLRGEALERLGVKLAGAWARDVGLALDRLAQLDAADPSGRFTGRLDLQRVGVVGHSLGGAAALQFCHDDARCKAGIDLDGAPHGSVVREGVAQPFMLLLSDHGSASDPEDRRVLGDLRSIFDRLPRDRRLRLAIRGANHYGFADGAVTRSHVLMGILRALGVLGLDGRRQLEVTARCVHAFLDVHLKGAPAAGLEGLRSLPELEPLD